MIFLKLMHCLDTVHRRSFGVEVNPLIVTGMTNYGHLIIQWPCSLALPYLITSTNAIPKVMVKLSPGLRKYSDAASELEKQYLRILTCAAHRRDAFHTELRTVNDRIRIEE